MLRFVQDDAESQESVMRISERVSRVGSGQMGPLSHRLDCNVYLLDGGDECALIDAGGGVEPERIVANINKAGVTMDRVRWLLLTHAHADHAAGACFFQSHYNLEVISAAEAGPWIETGDEEATSIGPARKAGVYPADFIYSPCPVARGVREGDSLSVGSLEIRVLETPGHSRGHVSYLFDDNGQCSIFAGDVVFAGGKIVLQNIWDCSIQEYAATLEKLHYLRIERLYPGHGPALSSEAHRDIESAHIIFRNLGIPPNL
jgi:glyoxylase-like metal-dependent hydrolase (beta-lactamase superfamily II)